MTSDQVTTELTPELIAQLEHDMAQIPGPGEAIAQMPWSVILAIACRLRDACRVLLDERSTTADDRAVVARVLRQLELDRERSEYWRGRWDVDGSDEAIESWLRSLLDWIAPPLCRLATAPDFAAEPVDRVP